jgi:hypothetical protein
MVVLESFAVNYLENYDIKTPINDIDKGNDSFYYALEYASGDTLHNPTMNEKCIQETRYKLYYLEVIALLKNKSNQESIKTLGEINNSIKPANEGIIGSSSIYKEKIIFILKKKDIQDDEPEFTIEIIIPPKITECNKNNILVLIQNNDTFRTFKHSSCKKVYPNEILIDKIQDIINKSKKETTEVIKYQLNNDVYKLSCGFKLFDTVLFHNLPKKNTKRKEIKTMKNLNQQFALLKKEGKLTVTNNSRRSVRRARTPLKNKTPIRTPPRSRSHSRNSKNRSHSRNSKNRSHSRNSSNNYSKIFTQYRTPPPSRPSTQLLSPKPAPPSEETVRQKTVKPQRPKSKPTRLGSNI